MRATLFHFALLAMFAPAIAHAAPTACANDQCKSFINDGPPVAGCCGALPAITKTLQVPQGACKTVDGAKVHVSITHEWVGDLVVSITAPNGVTKQLLSRFGSTVTPSGCPGEDLDADFTDAATSEGTCAQTIPALSGELIPAQALAPLDGSAATGTWTLSVSDGAGGRHGALRSWSVDPCGGSPVITAEASVYTVADAVVGGGDPGRFVIIRNAPYKQEFTVDYTVSGTAPAGSFIPLAGTVTIPANEPAAFVDVTPIASAVIGSTVIVTLTPGGEATIGTAGAATVTFVTSAPTTPTGTIPQPEEEPEEQPEPTPNTPKSGCACRASASDSLPLAALVLSMLVLRRRRRD